MRKVQLPISGGIYKNVDESALSNAGALLYDGYPDETGAINRRPCIAPLCDLGTGLPVDGVWAWRTQQKAVALSGGRLFDITDRLGTFVERTGVTMARNVRPTHVDFGANAYHANGGKIVKETSAGVVSEIADVDAPTTVTHVATLSKILLGNNKDTGEVHNSDVNDPDSWSAEYFEAESKPDNVTAMLVDGDEIYSCGPESTEVHYDDGTAFTANKNAFTGRGWSAPYSITKADNTIFGLDQDRQVVRLAGRTPQIISPAVNRYIQSFGTVSDALGDHINIGGRPFYVLSFPTEGKTLAYDYALQQWAEWSYFNTTKNERQRFRANCHAYCDFWNLHLVGDWKTGKIGYLSTDVYTDFGDMVVTTRRTGHIDHGTMERKKPFRLMIRARMDPGQSETPKMLVRWRDNGSQNWTSSVEVPMSRVGDTALVGQINRLGSYFTRQYEFSFSENRAFVLVSAEEWHG